jgi:pyochelin biosynthetic protein PchC
MTAAQRCLVVPCPRPRAEQRLVVFPHAGGGASFYRSWAELLGPDIELQIVQYPGREARIAEPLANLDTLVGEAAAALRGTGDRRVDTALFGHSMGAIVAHETTLALERQGARLTELFVSGRRAPGGDHPRDDGHTRDGQPRLSTDDEILTTVQRHGGTPAALFSDPEIRAILLRVLRNDYHLAESYRHAGGQLAEVGITALWSRADPYVDLAGIRRWSRFTRGRFHHHAFDGGHFYLVPQVRRVVDLVREQMTGPGPAHHDAR